MSLNQVLQILERCQFCLPRQFCEVCDEHWRKSLEPGGGQWSHRQYRCWSAYPSFSFVNLTVHVRRCPSRQKNVEEECLVQKLAGEAGQVSYDEVTGLPLDPELVADAIKEELMFMRTLRVHHEVSVSYLDKSGLKAIGTRWVCTNKGDAANPFIRARPVAQETKRVSELTPEDASSTFATAPPLKASRSCSVDA